MAEAFIVICIVVILYVLASRPSKNAYYYRNLSNVQRGLQNDQIAQITRPSPSLLRMLALNSKIAKAAELKNRSKR